MQPNYRRCVSCRVIKPRSDFWRIIRLYPSKTVQLDQGLGRSAYLCPSSDCLQVAQKKNRLARSLKAPVPESIYQALWQRLSEQPEPVEAKLQTIAKDFSNEVKSEKTNTKEPRSGD